MQLGYSEAFTCPQTPSKQGESVSSLSLDGWCGEKERKGGGEMRQHLHAPPADISGSVAQHLSVSRSGALSLMKAQDPQPQGLLFPSPPFFTVPTPPTHPPLHLEWPLGLVSWPRERAGGLRAPLSLCSQAPQGPTLKAGGKKAAVLRPCVPLMWGNSKTFVGQVESVGKGYAPCWPARPVGNLIPCSCLPPVLTHPSSAFLALPRPGLDS